MSANHNHDDWFVHTKDEGLPQQEHAGHVDTRALLIFYMAMLAFVVISIVGVALFFKGYVQNTRLKNIETLQLAVDANEYKADSLEEMTEYGWSGQIVEGAARIPIDEARRKVMESYEQR